MKIYKIKGSQISQNIAWLDMGYPLGESLGIMEKMLHCTRDQLMVKPLFYMIFKQLNYKTPDIFSINNI